MGVEGIVQSHAVRRLRLEDPREAEHTKTHVVREGRDRLFRVLGGGTC